jgi:hypothetical protein
VKLFLVFIILVATELSFGCFEQAPHLLSHSFSTNFDPNDISYGPAFENYCQELNKKDNFVKLSADKIYEEHSIEKFSALIDMQSRDLKENYRKKIKEIKKIKELNSRLKAVYELATSYFGVFNFSSKVAIKKLSDLDLKSTNSLKNSLLAVTYLAARLKKTDYSVSLVTTFPGQIETSRQWVRLELVSTDKVSHLDLDPSVTGLVFLPLLNRHSGLAEDEIKFLEKECLEVKNCLLAKK